MLRVAAMRFKPACVEIMAWCSDRHLAPKDEVDLPNGSQRGLRDKMCGRTKEPTDMREGGSLNERERAMLPSITRFPHPRDRIDDAKVGDLTHAKRDVGALVGSRGVLEHNSPVRRPC